MVKFLLRMAKKHRFFLRATLLTNKVCGMTEKNNIMSQYENGEANRESRHKKIDILSGREAYFSMV